ncbi:MAG: endonuclease/exonuclease/phosphatase family protein [Gracilimonas sp.]|nr:endonuclease/exonuclease/phosphatase family protein [Gracilimonas sp.]
MLLLIVLLVTVTNCTEQGQSSAMTYNIRYATERDGINSWEHRKNQLIQTKPDVFGIQEGLHHQVQYLDSALTDYKYVGVGWDDGNTGGEYTAIFYKTNKLDVVDSDTFWLSETPDTVSVGWDASMERITTWARFKERESNKEFWVFNAHLDHIGAQSRLNSLKVIRQFIDENNEDRLPIILMGDFNAEPESDPITYLNWLMDDTRTISKRKPKGPVGTFHGFDPEHPLDRRIDYIFVSSGIEVLSYEAILEQNEGHFPSDHLPVLVGYLLD